MMEQDTDGTVAAWQAARENVIKPRVAHHSGKTPWAHLDIAGVAWSKKDRPLVPKGSSGFGVRLLDRLLSNHYEERS